MARHDYTTEPAVGVCDTCKTGPRSGHDHLCNGTPVLFTCRGCERKRRKADRANRDRIKALGLDRFKVEVAAVLFDYDRNATRIANFTRQGQAAHRLGDTATRNRMERATALAGRIGGRCLDRLGKLLPNIKGTTPLDAARALIDDGDGGPGDEYIAVAQGEVTPWRGYR